MLSRLRYGQAARHDPSCPSSMLNYSYRVPCLLHTQQGGSIARAKTVEKIVGGGGTFAFCPS